ncbi:MAG: hypothetical protein QHH75_14535 [Bacillota bacterium]|nr:hypothetical protein [Bacillota bacterium]
MDQGRMIEQILAFVEQHQESQATRTVCRRILGSHPGRVTRETLSDLQNRLEAADPEEVEACYYLIK